MWVKSKQMAQRLEHETRERLARDEARQARIEALERELGDAHRVIEAQRQQLAHHRGVAANLVRFGSSVSSLGDSFEYLAAQLAHSQDRAGQVAEAALASRQQFGALRGEAQRMEDGLDQASQKVQSLAECSREINGIVDLISGIASQTNLLALNAAIEAARAGSAGRGFAVVASEIRSLAEKTALATDDIVRKIGEVQEEIRSVHTHIRLQGESAQGFNHTAEEAVQAMERLRELAGAMRRSSETSALRAGVELANLDELSLKFVVYNHLLGNGEQPPELPSERDCRFGRWYYGDADRQLKLFEGFAQIERPHTAVHAQGQAAITAFGQGELTLALQSLERMEDANLQVMRIVNGLLDRLEQAPEIGAERGERQLLDA